jgi:hypothetical protein
MYPSPKMKCWPSVLVSWAAARLRLVFLGSGRGNFVSLFVSIATGLYGTVGELEGERLLILLPDETGGNPVAKTLNQ